MKISEIVSRRINHKKRTFELLTHEISFIVYNTYTKIRKKSLKFSIGVYQILPNDTVYEYVEELKSIQNFIKDNNIDIPQCNKLLFDLLEYLDNQ